MFTFSRDFVMSRFWKDLFFTFIGERYPCALSSDNDIHVFCLDLIPRLFIEVLLRCREAMSLLVSLALLVGVFHNPSIIHYTKIKRIHL